MSHITTCSHCSRLYCEESEESAHEQDRLCNFCFKAGMKHPGKCRCVLCKNRLVYQAKLRALKEEAR